MSTAVFYSDDFLCTGYGTDTREKAAHIAESLAERPIDSVELRTAEDIAIDVVAAVHDPRYVQAILTGRPESLASRNGIGEWSRDLGKSVFSMTGAVVQSALLSTTTGLHSGSLASGLHHAKYSHGAGFCTFNGLVVAARAALTTGVSRVLIIDLDAHCGGGTASLIQGLDGVEQVDVSVSRYDQYVDTANARLVLSAGATYLDDITHALSSVTSPASIGLVIYNAGMDPYEHCSTGGASGIGTHVLQQREHMVFGWANEHGLPVSFTLAGGYSGRNVSKNQLVDLHRLTIDEAARANRTLMERNNR